MARRPASPVGPDRPSWGGRAATKRDSPQRHYSRICRLDYRSLPEGHHAGYGSDEPVIPGKHQTLSSLRVGADSGPVRRRKSRSRPSRHIGNR